MFMTADEIADLTGYRRPSCQIRWLKQNGWPVVIGGDQKPKVLRDVAQVKLGAAISTTQAEPRLQLCARKRKTGTYR